jgi:hypothetical protein
MESSGWFASYSQLFSLVALVAERKRKSIILLEGSQATPARPSGRNKV